MTNLDPIKLLEDCLTFCVENGISIDKECDEYAKRVAPINSTHSCLKSRCVDRGNIIQRATDIFYCKISKSTHKCTGETPCALAVPDRTQTLFCPISKKKFGLRHSCTASHCHDYGYIEQKGSYKFRCKLSSIEHECNANMNCYIYGVDTLNGTSTCYMSGFVIPTINYDNMRTGSLVDDDVDDKNQPEFENASYGNEDIEIPEVKNEGQPKARRGKGGQKRGVGKSNFMDDVRFKLAIEEIIASFLYCEPKRRYVNSLTKKYTADVCSKLIYREYKKSKQTRVLPTIWDIVSICCAEEAKKPMLAIIDTDNIRLGYYTNLLVTLWNVIEESDPPYFSGQNAKWVTKLAVGALYMLAEPSSINQVISSDTYLNRYMPAQKHIAAFSFKIRHISTGQSMIKSAISNMTSEMKQAAFVKIYNVYSQFKDQIPDLAGDLESIPFLSLFASD